MKKILSKSHWLIAKHGISLVAVFAMLVVAFVAIAPDLSFGWFSKNNQVSAKGMTVQADHPDFDVYYRASDAADWTLIDISDPSDIDVVGKMQAPGASATFEIKIVNKSQRSVALQAFGFAAPTATEEVANAAGVYLSTELYTTLLNVGQDNGTTVEAITGVAVNNAPALDTTGVALSTGQVNFVTYVTNQSVTVAAGDNVVFEVKVQFLNRDISQNDFKNFGVGGDGTCQRRLYFTYNELNS